MDKLELASQLYSVGSKYYRGGAVSRNWSVAATLLCDALEAGLPEESIDDAKRMLARSYYWLGRECTDKEDLEEAVAFYKKSAEMSDPYGLCELGRCYRKGAGIERDLRKAFSLSESAASLGDFGGTFDMAMSYSRGEGVKRDLDRSKELFLKATECIDEPKTSYRNLALCYECAGHDEWKALRYDRAKVLWEKAQKVLYKYGSLDPDFDYLSDPAVDRISHNIVAADGAIKGAIEMVGTVVEIILPW